MSYTNGKKKRQRTTHTKFQTQLGMSIIRRDEAIVNSLIKRGVWVRPDDVVREQHIICGCGAEGCIFVSVIREGESGQQMMKDGKDPYRKN